MKTQAAAAETLNQNTTTSREILSDLLIELYKADQKYGPMQEPVDGLYTIRCELEKLSREVMRYGRDPQAIRREAVQVGAMAVKFLRDCCGNLVP